MPPRGDTSGGSDGGLAGAVLPSGWVRPLAQLVGLYREYGSIPKAIFGLISTYIVSSVFGFGGYVVSSILAVFDWITLSLAWVQVELGGSFTIVGFRVLNAYRWVQGQLGNAAASAGPLAPVIAIAIGAVIFAVLYRALIALLGELPGGSSIVDFLGLR
ncbi:hypothetical protein [Halosimplex sp. TS25]|uniref:hypothetical protein n=1 Tax=Halosimplex rarum TaxID=3396619 RepID=UPI0039E9EF54